MQVLKDGVAGVDGLDGTGSLTVSPNGQHVYVTGNREDAIAVFRRDKTSGTLTFEQVLKSGGGEGVEGLESPQWVAVSPDGEHLYVACWRGTLVVFSAPS